MKFLLVSIFCTCALTSTAQQKLQKPTQFLGYEPGERFTRHHRVIDYFQHVAAVVPNAKLFEYGQTYEHRPLVYMVISSPENINNLEQIRKDNLRRTGLLQGVASDEKKAIIWLSYNVHGNEANSMEAAMLTLYDLADVSNTKTQQWLKNTVVIIDPCVNPDGRDRYANFYNQTGNIPPNPALDANEHHEPWPGGRPNHYLFDLNRDWAWTTQIESKKRIKVFNEWLPQVHVDFHEQGYNNPYFFAPAAEPMHEVISPWQRNFQVMIGKNNARYFDQQGWLYFTKEVFDLYYPSYGDTYPTYNGAIGMTYEQAGGGIGGLAITTETGDPLTLKDRITHHHTTGLSTIEISSVNATRLVDEYEKYFRENNTNPSATNKTYVIKGDNDPDKLQQLTEWMSQHAIRYGHTTSPKASRGYDYQTQNTASFNISSEDIIISAFQPKSRFITTIFEPTSKLSDSLTYDITAWNLIYAYDLNAYATTEKIIVGKAYESKGIDNSAVVKKPYAYIFKYQHVRDVALLTALMKKNVKVRSAQRSFGLDGQIFPAGSLIVTQRNNESVNDLHNTVITTANEFNRKVFTANTGFVEQGKDFGSGGLRYLKNPRVAVLFGDQTSSLSAGEIWHFFEQQIYYPITQIGTDYLKNVDLKNYDVLIVPEGKYKFFDDPTLEQFSNWVAGGGKLIVMGSALNNFSDKKGFALQKYSPDDEKVEEETQVTAYKTGGAFIRYEEMERDDLAGIISGAIYKIRLDNSHPLGFGLRASYYTLKNNELRFGFLKNGWNVGYFGNKVKPIQGFAGFRANERLDNSLVFGVENKGAGHVIYMVDNPLFRSFWENGKMLFANAVFMVGK